MDDKIDKKLDKISEKISSIDITLAKQSVVLEEHVKRTNLLEAKMEPVENHVAMVNGAIKLLGLLAVVAGIIIGVIELVITIMT